MSLQDSPFARRVQDTDSSMAYHFGNFTLTACFVASATFADEQDRQIFVAMSVAIAEATAVYEHQVVEQR